jgi:hypothetical protein
MVYHRKIIANNGLKQPIHPYKKWVNFGFDHGNKIKISISGQNEEAPSQSDRSRCEGAVGTY